MLFNIKYHGDIYGVFAVTNKGSEHDAFLIYKNNKFKWVFISACELV